MCATNRENKKEKNQNDTTSVRKVEDLTKRFSLTEV